MPRITEIHERVRRAVTLFLLALIPILLIAVFFSVQKEFTEMRGMRSAIEKNAATRDNLRKMVALHLDVETGVRGYAITRDPAFIARYEANRGELSKIAQSLSANAEAGDRAVIARLDQASNAKLAMAELNIEDVRAGRLERATNRIAAGGGRRLMDSIRTIVSSLESREVARIASLSDTSAGSRDEVERKILGLLIGLAAILMMVTLMISFSMRKRREALDQAERLNERQKAMFDGAVDGMLLLDEEGRILRMNPSISRMFGYEEADLLGKPNLVLMADTFSLNDAEQWLATIGAAGTNGAGRRQEFTGRRADGTLFETEVAISRVSSSSGRRYVAAIRDISDRKRAEKMKTEFVSTVSHELRTPLTSIAGSLGLLGAGAVGPLNEKAGRLVEIAHSNCERLVRLINDILDIEKMESGKMDFDLRKMQAAPLIKRTVEAMRGYADQHEVSITTVLPPWPQCLRGDPDKLEQLLTNLLSNAIKHSPKGGTVEVFSTQERGQIKIEVRDRGAGVPEEFRARIFGKFAMADASDSRAAGGTGLGLAIAREIARRHGGDVGFEDREGGGTVFHFGVPLLDRNEEGGPAKTDPNLPQVLHLDDDQDTLSLVASAFAGQANIVSAHTLAEARDLIIRGDRFDAAILDVGLAYESGLDLVSDLRAVSRRMPIVVFTAIDEARESGDVDRVLIKSRSSLPDLVRTTLRLLDKRREAA